MLDLERLIELYVDAKDLPPNLAQGIGNTIKDFILFVQVTGFYLTPGPGRN